MMLEITNGEGCAISVCVDNSLLSPLAIVCVTDRADGVSEDRVARICLTKREVNSLIRTLVAARDELPLVHRPEADTETDSKAE